MLISDWSARIFAGVFAPEVGSDVSYQGNKLLVQEPEGTQRGGQREGEVRYYKAGSNG